MNSERQELFEEARGEGKEAGVDQSLVPTIVTVNPYMQLEIRGSRG